MTREIKISAVLNGWVVHVGCQTVVFNDLNHMVEELRSYYTNPEAVEKTYLKGAINKVKGIEPISPEPEQNIKAFKQVWTGVMDSAAQERSVAPNTGSADTNF